MNTIRAVLYYLLVTVVTITHALLSLTIGPFLPFKQRHWFITLWCRMNIALLKFFCGVNYRVSGLENIPQSNGVVLCNHQSSWETFYLHLLFKPQTTVLKESLIRIPLFGHSLKLLEPIIIDRDQKIKALKQVVNQGREKLNKGSWIVIYPEGTRIDPGQPSEYSSGGALLATKTAYPITPVVHNAGEFCPAKRLKKMSGTIDVVIGPQIVTKGRKAKEVTIEVEEWIRENYARISTL